MRIFFTFIFICFGFAFTLSFPTWAQCDLSSGNAVDFLKHCADGVQNSVDPNNTKTDTAGVKDLVKNITTKAIGFWALFAIGVIVFAGIRYTTSFGDEEKIKHAKTTGIYALIGLLLLGLAFPLVDTVVNFIYTLGN